MSDWKCFKRLLISLIFSIGCLISGNANAQLIKNPAQESLAMKFMGYLEFKMIDSCLLAIEGETAQKSQIQRNQFISAAKEIEKILGHTTPSIILVGRDKKLMYRCRYYNRKDRYEDFFQADIYFRNAKAEKIEKVVFTGRQQLIEEQKLREKSANEPPAEPPPVKKGIPK